MSIYSVIIHTKPENINSVSNALEKIEGVELHATSDLGKLIVTLDHPDRAYCSDILMGFHNIPGVLNSSLVYEYFEEDDKDGETLVDESLKLLNDACELKDLLKADQDSGKKKSASH
jgi:nitrate reductase NapD